MKAVVIGSSTGGPSALEKILSELDAPFEGVIIVVQHLPREFTNSMVKRLTSVLPIPIKIAQIGEELKPSNIYVVPGDKHFFLVSPGLRIFLIDAPDVVHPSIDMGFTSVAEHFGPDTLGIVLTGMGDDGVLGAKAIKQVGGTVYVQNRATSAVYGMPFAVRLAGYADEVLPLEEMSRGIMEFINGYQ